MLNNPLFHEDYLLAAKQEEIAREITQNNLLKEINIGCKKQPLLSKILVSIGRVLVKFGNYLVSKCEGSKFSSIRHQNVKIV